MNNAISNYDIYLITLRIKKNNNERSIALKQKKSIILSYDYYMQFFCSLDSFEDFLDLFEQGLKNCEVSYVKSGVKQMAPGGRSFEVNRKGEKNREQSVFLVSAIYRSLKKMHNFKCR
jgi:hypothetical protein